MTSFLNSAIAGCSWFRSRYASVPGNNAPGSLWRLAREPYDSTPEMRQDLLVCAGLHPTAKEVEVIQGFASARSPVAPGLFAQSHIEIKPGQVESRPHKRRIDIERLLQFRFSVRWRNHGSRPFSRYTPVPGACAQLRSADSSLVNSCTSRGSSVRFSPVAGVAQQAQLHALWIGARGLRPNHDRSHARCEQDNSNPEPRHGHIIRLLSEKCKGRPCL